MKIILNVRHWKVPEVIFFQGVDLDTDSVSRFSHQGETSSFNIFYHFVENKKLHKISQIQSGVSIFQNMAANILPKIDRDKCHVSLVLDYITPLNR